VPLALPRLRRDLALDLVPAAADVDEIRFQVDVLIAEGADLAATQAGVEGDRPERSVGFGESLEKLRCLGR
jgi:hypothetical protein